jgi:predicted RND superfamily exporter protein
MFQGEAWEVSASTRASGASAFLGMPWWLVVAIAVALLIAIALAYR